MPGQPLLTGPIEARDPTGPPRIGRGEGVHIDADPDSGQGHPGRQLVHPGSVARFELQAPALGWSRFGA
jgi:hypothetical protein